MEVRAKLSNLRISPRKVRLVVDAIRGLDVVDAEAQLTHMPKRASKPLLTLLKSAVANAEHNFKLSKDNLFIKEIKADEAKTLYRYTPRAYGRATPIRKRASHVTIVLAERVVKLATEKPAKTAKKKEAPKKAAAKPAKKEKSAKKTSVKKEEKPAEKKAKPAKTAPAKKEEKPATKTSKK